MSNFASDDQVLWECHRTTGYGRHGYFYISGLDIVSTGLEIRITPITGRGSISSSNFIDIPKSEIKNVIDTLSKFI